MSRERVIELRKYVCIANQDVYYGFPKGDAKTKNINHITFMEVINDLKHPKVSLVRFDSIVDVGSVKVVM